jgi:C-terminal processing protease CtpA/Prc
MKPFYAIATMICANIAICEQIPENLLSGLAAEDFKTRLDSQEKLLEWARNSSNSDRLDELYARYMGSEDPETRSRCYNILRKLVEDLYLKDGKGYVGIIMGVAKVAEGDVEGFVEKLRIDAIVPDGPADQAGMLVGDLIEEVSGKKLGQPNVMDAFKALVQSRNPGEIVPMKLQRADKELSVTVTLGKLPAGADLQFFGEPQMSLEELDRSAKEAHFKNWLEKKKAQKVP